MSTRYQPQPDPPARYKRRVPVRQRLGERFLIIAIGWTAMAMMGIMDPFVAGYGAGMVGFTIHDAYNRLREGEPWTVSKPSPPSSRSH